MKVEIGFKDEKMPKENGQATIGGEPKKHRPPHLKIQSTENENEDAMSLTSLKRTTSRSSIASVRDRIMVILYFYSFFIIL